MNWKSVSISALITLIGLTLLYTSGLCGESPKNVSSAEKITAETKITAKIPQLIDLGSKGCIPCKKMAPILDSLREEYKGRAEITFIDTRENRKAAADYKITLIPTQIFFDTLGVEVFRHVGFFPADSIVAHLKAVGVKP